MYLYSITPKNIRIKQKAYPFYGAGFLLTILIDYCLSHQTRELVLSPFVKRPAAS